MRFPRCDHFPVFPAYANWGRVGSTADSCSFLHGGRAEVAVQPCNRVQFQGFPGLAFPFHRAPYGCRMTLKTRCAPAPSRRASSSGNVGGAGEHPGGRVYSPVRQGGQRKGPPNWTKSRTYVIRFLSGTLTGRRPPLTTRDGVARALAMTARGPTSLVESPLLLRFIAIHRPAGRYGPPRPPSPAWSSHPACAV